MSKKLVKIQPIPPLRQSTSDVMGCPLFYVTVFIKGKKQPSGLESARGTQVHAVGSSYASWCAVKGVSMDLDAFDNLAKGAGPQAAKILVGMRDSYKVDFQHLFATEVPMQLDENFHPTDIPDVLNGIAEDSGLDPSYQGTLDTLYMFKDESKILVDDLKTHPHPFDPSDTLQGKMYSLFCFLFFPWVMEVQFRLVFVRYRNLTRGVVYTRDDLPMMIETVKSARDRQLMIHENYESGKEIEAIPGSQCVYCPLLSNRKCPIAEFNPNMQLTPVDRLKYHIWYSSFSALNNKALKDYIQGTGRNVVLRDYNGKNYVYGPEEKQSNVYPLFVRNGKDILTDPQGNPIMPVIGQLMTHREISPEDCDWLPNLVISSSKLESALKASKRVITHQAIVDNAEKVTKVTMKVSKPLDTLPPDIDDEDGEDGEDTDF